MRFRTGVRARLTAAAAIFAMVATGLILGAQPSSAATIQTGHVNYVGPGPCPTGSSTTDNKGPSCILTSGPVNVEQHAATSATDLLHPDGSNTIDCRTAPCDGSQQGPVGSEIAKPTNTASCNDVTSLASTAQECTFTQLGGSNTITATLRATPSASTSVGNSTLAQTSKQRFTTSQNGDNNTLTVNGQITQTATTGLDTSLPQGATQTQRTLQLSNSQMTANVSNVANFVLNRSQSSTITGALSPILNQDDTAGAEPDGATLGLAEVNLTANSSGTNQIKIRGADTKTQSASNVLGTPVLTQGHRNTSTTDYNGSGVYGKLAVNSATQNPPGTPDIDIGIAGQADSGTNTGFFKKWTQTASSISGGTPVAKQYDGLPVHILGQSPFFVTSNSNSDIRSINGANVLCTEDASGHTHVNWTGQLFFHCEAGSKVKEVTVPFTAQNPDVSATCEWNTDTCTVTSTNKPHSEAQMAGRNVTTNQQFTSGTYNSPSSITASPGDTVEYRATFHNEGDAGSTAPNATLTTTVPANTTYVSGCDTGCNRDGSTVSWSLGNVAGGSYVSRTLDVQVNPNAPAGNITNQATPADDAETGLPASNQVVVNIPSAVGCAGSGCFVLGSTNAGVNTGQHVEWWGSDWCTKNPVGGSCPSSFKGYASKVSGSSWSSTGGTSAPPASALPAGGYMVVLVTNNVSKSLTGTVSGNIVGKVIVKIDPGYSPNSGGTGTGTVVATAQ